MTSTETFCHFGHLLQVSKKTLCSLILYNFFHDFIHVYSPGAGTDNPLGQNFDVNSLSLQSFVASFKKISLKSLLYIAPGQGKTAPWGQSFDVNRNVLSLHSFVDGLKKMSLKSDFIHFFHETAPGQGAYSPQRTKF